MNGSVSQRWRTNITLIAFHSNNIIIRTLTLENVTIIIIPTKQLTNNPGLHQSVRYICNNPMNNLINVKDQQTKSSAAVR